MRKFSDVRTIGKYFHKKFLAPLDRCDCNVVERPRSDARHKIAILLADFSQRAGIVFVAVMRSLAKGLRLSKPEDTADGYEVIKTLYERKIYPSADGVRNTIRLLGASNEKIRGLRAEDLIDDRTVRKLEQKGLFQTLSK